MGHFANDISAAYMLIYNLVKFPLKISLSVTCFHIHEKKMADHADYKCVQIY